MMQKPPSGVLTSLYVNHFALRGQHPRAKMRRVSSKILKKSTCMSCLFGLFGFLVERN